MLRVLLPLLVFFLVNIQGINAPAAEKVILDSDMVEGFDDGVAMMLLASAPEIDLVGITITSGNSWVAEGTAHALRQLEIIGRTDVPVYMGLTRPFRAGRTEGIEAELKCFGVGPEAYTGAFPRPDPENWLEFYRTRYGRDPERHPEETHAVNFIIETVRNNPGEITILAIGPLGNLALAVKIAPDIVPLIKRVIYMGGSFFQSGNVTPAAEFNWWFDPEAARVMVRTPFREQTVFSLDVCEKVKFTRSHFFAILDMLGQSEIADILRDSIVGRDFTESPAFFQYIWDSLAAIALIEPSLILNFVQRPIDVVDTFGPTYGQSLAFDGSGPANTQTVTIVTDINLDRFWEILLTRQSWTPSR